MARRKHHSGWFIAKEILLGLLAIASISLVLYDVFGNPSGQIQKTINHADFVIACVFLADFAISLLLSKHRRKYLTHNWYFLLAAIPFTDTLTESLRGLRVLRLLRMVRAGEHLDFGVKSSKG